MKTWSSTKSKIRKLRILWIVIFGIIGGLFFRHYEITTRKLISLKLQKSLSIVQTTPWIDSQGATRLLIVVDPKAVEGVVKSVREKCFNYVEDDLVNNHYGKWDYIEITTKDKSYKKSYTFTEIVERAIKRRQQREMAWAETPDEWRNYTPRIWSFIDIHHSATHGGSLAAFDKVHRKKGMNNGVAYHFSIGNGNGIPDGEVEVSSRWHRQIGSGATQDDAFNNSSIAICLVGDFTKEYPTKSQMASLTTLIKSLSGVYQIPIERVLSHRRIRASSTLCPGKNFDMQKLVNALGYESQGEFNTSQISTVYK